MSISRSSTSLLPQVFGARLRQARERCGLPQDKLGVLIGLDEHTASARISRYETGVHEPPISTARQLAKALNVSLAYLYCDEDDLAEIILVTKDLGPEGRQRVTRYITERLQVRN